MPHKISFSIIDILDPKKFNSRRVSELSAGKEKFPAQRPDGANLLDCDRTAGGDVESAEAGRGGGEGATFFRQLLVCGSACSADQIVMLFSSFVRRFFSHFLKK